MLAANGNAGSTTLLIADDNPADTTLCMRLLEDVQHPFSAIHCLSSLQATIDYIIDQPPACCILDYSFPDGSAELLLERIGKLDHTGACPIVITTGYDDAKLAVDLMHNGAQDYLVKHELTAGELIRAINNAMRTWALQKQLNYLALHDPLTGLVNRTLFVDRLSNLFQESVRHQRHFALIYVDLDRFKKINDTFGHEAGDFLLGEAAKRISDTLRKTDTAARLGGDEFAIILPDTSQPKAYHVAQKLVVALTTTIDWNDTLLSLSPSLGLSFYPGNAASYQELMREADVALYRSKESGRGRFSAFNERMAIEISKYEAIAAALPKAIVERELQVAYQPIYNLENNEVVDVEALVRWNLEGEWVSPAVIIDMILERQLAEFFHEWLFDTSISQLVAWRKTQANLGLSLNMPASLGHDTEVIKRLEKTAQRYGLPASAIMIEITETHLMHHPEAVQRQLITLAEKGFRIAIDDFGTGYSSMQYLASLPCDTLKIDQTFFLTLNSNPKNKKIIQAITVLAHELSLNVVAEGLESDSLLGSAQKFSCDRGQGFHLGTPSFPCEKFGEFLQHTHA